MTYFTFVLLTLLAYRAQRIVTRDDWPPSEWFRDRIERRFGPNSSWYTLVTCHWCFGTWATFATFAVASAWLALPPHWAVQAGAAAAVVGLIGDLEG